jgi:hypothetical protein
LTKFLKSVSWTDSGEARQAIQILPKWTEIDVGDALELLSAKFDNRTVRAYAVDRLRKADDEVKHPFFIILSWSPLMTCIGAAKLPAAVGASLKV